MFSKSSSRNWRNWKKFTQVQRQLARMEDAGEKQNAVSEWFASIVLSAAKDPWGFIYTFFLYMSPLLVASLFLSFKLVKDLKSQKTDKKKKVKRDNKGKKKKTKDG